MSTPAPVAMNADEQLREKVFFELEWAPEIPAPVVDDIAIAVKDGVVTLSGTVPTYWLKDAAEIPLPNSPAERPAASIILLRD
jgi:osmotically-inducible protein OsmY